MAECEWCDRPMCPLSELDRVPTHYNYSFEERLGPCKRGPIERELRALTTYAVAVDNHSRAAASIIVGAATDMLHRGHDAIDNGVAFDDYMSEAIEAAAALGL